MPVPIVNSPDHCATIGRIIAFDGGFDSAWAAGRSETKRQKLRNGLGAPSFISHVSTVLGTLAVAPVSRPCTYRSLGCLLQDQRPRKLVSVSTVWARGWCFHGAHWHCVHIRTASRHPTRGFAAPAPHAILIMQPHPPPYIYGLCNPEPASLPLPIHYQFPQCSASSPVALQAVTGHMSPTTDHLNVLLDSSNYPASSYSSSLSLATDVAGPSSISSSSYLVPQFKANTVDMGRPATKKDPLPRQVHSHTPSAIAHLPYRIHAADARAVTTAHDASDCIVPQHFVPLPRGGAPVRPTQRLHLNRMQPFPSRLIGGAVHAERQGRRYGASHHFNMAMPQMEPALAPSFPLGIPPIAGRGPPLLQSSNLSQPCGPLFFVPHPALFVPPKLPGIDHIPLCLPQPPVLVAPRVTQLRHAGVTFNVSHLLGEGSAGRVVLGENGGRLYAIKVIHPRRAKRTHSHRSNFLRERAFMITVGSREWSRRFFVPLLMSWEEDGYGNQGRMFFVMVRSYLLVCDRYAENDRVPNSLFTRQTCMLLSAHVSRCPSRTAICTVRSW